MSKRFQMPPYDPADTSSLQYALDQTEIFLNSTVAALEADVAAAEAALALAPRFKSLSSDASAVVGVAYGDAAPGLDFAVTSGVPARYYFIVVWTANAATTGARFSVAGPSGTYAHRSAFNTTATAFSVANTLGRTTDSGFTVGTDSNASSANLGIVEGIVLPTASGNVRLRSSADVASPGSVTVKAGSSVLYW